MDTSGRGCHPSSGRMSLMNYKKKNDMTQEEKQLLLKDLCARLPYLVKGLYQWKGNVPFDRELDGRLYDELYLSLYATEDSSFKPYLRPMSSMTEEEFKQLKEYSGLLYGELDLAEFQDNYKCLDFYLSEVPSYVVSLVFDWLNEHHFDYRQLIERGLALDAPKDMYKTE